ncbi:MAG: transcriptional regulator NrdR [Patescibacteria group bacterium]|nr:transcriptional regulator NrdR [Patescibacteria group bacterium]
MMKCSKCNQPDTKVIDSRIIEDGQTIRRRRECEKCGFRFTTFERVGVTDLMVVKKNGTKEFYDRLKLKRAIMLAFANSVVTSEEINNLLNTLELSWITGNIITSEKIAEDVMMALKDDYPVAYVRYISVYKKFKSLDDFKSLLQ